MAKFRKKPVVVVIDAVQWFYNEGGSVNGGVVNYYGTPGLGDLNTCQHCNVIMRNHGWIDTLEGGHIVCSGDWVITEVHGEKYPCKPDIFEQTYDAVEDMP